MNELQLQLLSKMVKIHARAPECCKIVQRIAEKPRSFKRFVSKLDDLLKEAEAGKPSKKDETELTEEMYKVYEMVVHSAPLLELFRSELSFSQVSPTEVATFAQFADVSPSSDPERVLQTRDQVFMRILRSAIKQILVLPRTLLQRDMAKLIALDAGYAEIATEVHLLAQHDSWTEQCLAIEARLGPSSSDEVTDQLRTLNKRASRIVELIEGNAESGKPASDLRRLLDKEPKFSEMLREEVSLYWEVRDELPPADELLAKEFLDLSTLSQKHASIAQEAIKRMPSRPRKKVEDCFGLRVDAVDYFLSLRKFAKLQALSYRWPELAAKYRRDRHSLKGLEGQAKGGLEAPDPSQASDSVQALYERYKNDEDLGSFFRLRPLLRHIEQDEIDLYFKISQEARPSIQEALSRFQVRPTMLQLVPSAADVTASPMGVEATLVSATPPAAEPAQADLPFEDLRISLHRLDADQEEEEVTLRDTSSFPREADYRVVVSTATESEETRITILWQEVWKQVEKVYIAHHGGYPRRDLGPEPRAADQMLGANAQLRKAGAFLYDLIFQGAVRKLIEQTLGTGRSLRIFLDIIAPELMLLPFELLYVPGLRTFLALTQKYSLVRHVEPARTSLPPGIERPLRILVVPSSPRNLAPVPMMEEEKQTIKRVLAVPLEEGLVQLEFLTPPTLENLQGTLRRFQPHIFHFVGHGGYVREAQQGSLLLEDADGMARPLLADDARLLFEYNTNLAVLNACETGTASTNDAITSVAGTLIDTGVPAVVATTRAVSDRGALMFAREFYASFVDGYSLEASVTEGRKALSVERLDWFVYALLTGTRELSALRLMPEWGRASG